MPRVTWVEGDGVASSPRLLWLDWLVWGQWQGAGGCVCHHTLRVGRSGASMEKWRQHLYPPEDTGLGASLEKSLRQQGGRRGRGQSQAWAALGDVGRLPKPL